MAGEGQFAGAAIDAEDGDVVGSLVAHIKELADGIEIEAAGIVSTCPFLTVSSPVLAIENIPMLSCKRLPA